MIANLAVEAMERRLLPDPIVRFGIRRLCRARLRDESRGPDRTAFTTSLREGPIAPVPAKANEQHYEVPAAFFAEALGAHRKYSSAYWGEPAAPGGPFPITDLDAAEATALEVTMERAALADGMSILELGCGWGSLTLRMAERFPGASIVAVSNSSSQRAYITAEAQRRGFTNVEVRTADMNEFDPGARFDRVVSVEMFEHMRNYDALLQRIRHWLEPDGRLFVHIFCHRTHTYPFETEVADNWMGRHFFTGGIMPSEKLLGTFDDALTVEGQWNWNGRHYARTARAWLDNIDAKRDAVLPILADTYGKADAARWYHRWRVFFMACEELFAYDGGNEWYVTHLRFAPRA